MGRFFVLVGVLASALFVSVGSATAAVPGNVPSGKIMLGVGGTATTPGKFRTVTRHRQHIYVIFTAWGQGLTWGKRYNAWLADAKRGNYRLMVSLRNTAKGGTREAISPRRLAKGYGDGKLISMSKVFNESNQTVYFRPLAEMNGHWNPASAFNANGSKRNAAHSTRQFRGAFRRMTLIMRGGNVATINSKLRRAGLPKLRTTALTLPRSGKVSIVWNPQGEGSPNVRGNQPRDYYPGPSYVDFVANDLYAQRYRAHWVAHNRLYNDFKRHPFMVAEWAPWGTDDPAFVDRMFAWARTHKRTKALLYFNGTSSRLFTLNAKPRSKARYRKHVRARRFTCTCPA
jgi:hypothetical protein